MQVIGSRISVESEDQLMLTVHKKNKVRLPSFTGIGLGFQRIIFLQIGRAARFLLNELIIRRDIDTNIAEYSVQGNSAKSLLTKAYKELKDSKIAIRIKKQTYLLNPAAVIPRKEGFPTVEAEWRKYEK